MLNMQGMPNMPRMSNLAGLDISTSVTPLEVKPGTGVSREIAVNGRSSGESFETVLSRVENGPKTTPVAARKHASKADNSKTKVENNAAGSEADIRDGKVHDQPSDSSTPSSEGQSGETTQPGSNIPIEGQAVSGGESTATGQPGAINPGSTLHQLIESLISNTVVNLMAMPISAGDVVQAVANTGEQPVLPPVVRATPLVNVSPDIPIQVKVPGGESVPEPGITGDSTQSKGDAKPDGVRISISTPDIPVIVLRQPPQVTSVISGPDQQAQMSLADQLQRSEPTNLQAPRSEWTDTLDLTRLINTRSGRPESVQTNENRQVVPDKPVWRPDLASSRQEYSRDQSVFRDPEPAGNSAFIRPASHPAIITETAPKVIAETQAPVITAQTANSGVNLFSTAAVNGSAQAIFDIRSALEQVQGGVTSQANGSVQANDAEALMTGVREVMMRIAADGRGEARLVLHPPELGELVVRLESAKNGVLRAEFHTVSPLVRESLESGISKLIDSLKSEGLTLSKAEVHLHLNLGSEGNAGEQEALQDKGNGSLFNNDRYSLPEFDEPVPVIEWLPEGATISVLA